MKEAVSHHGKNESIFPFNYCSHRYCIFRTGAECDLRKYTFVVEAKGTYSMFGIGPAG